MAQARFRREPPPPAVVYNTSMTTPDAALALAALWSFERSRRARVGGVCVTGGGYAAAVFCDIVSQFYRPGERHGNDALAVGLADFTDPPDDGPLVTAPVARTNAAGEPLYARTIHAPTDTSLAEAQLRNAITFNAENSVVLSAPAYSLARSLEIVANRDLYAAPVQRLVLVESPRLLADPAALAYLLEAWPTEIVIVPAVVTAPVTLGITALDAAFAWAETHPVVDAWRAWAAASTGDIAAVPAADLIALVYAVTPASALFALGPTGAARPASGGIEFTETVDGRVRRLGLAGETAALGEALIAAAATEPD